MSLSNSQYQVEMNEPLSPRLVRIRVYPVKSLEAVELERVEIYNHGMLRYDRSFALFEGNGEIIKAKSNPELHRLHANVDIYSWRADFRVTGDAKTQSFQLNDDRAALNEWLSEVFGRPIRFHGDHEFGFADDWTATGPTLVSTATIETVASWYEHLSPDDIRQRLRANLEVDGVPAFWEDQLYGATVGEMNRFRIGSVELFGKNACQRCPIPTRDVETGIVDRTFARNFILKRMETLPAWAHSARFDNYYRVAINTMPASIEQGSSIEVGEILELV